MIVAPSIAGLSLIPVLDLKAGVVVHARAGDRANYRPIETPLSASSAPADVLAGLLALAPFAAVYIADLDAIERRGDHGAIVRDLAHRAAPAQIWIDSGCADAGAALALAAAGLVPVIGSESLADAVVVAELLDRLGPERFVLSLDHRGADFLGPAALATETHLWPRRVIVMTLDRVGAGRGPALDRLSAVRGRATRHDVFAAGGVRGRDDLVDLARAGISGALVATALHDGRLSRDVLAEVMPTAPG